MSRDAEHDRVEPRPMLAARGVMVAVLFVVTTALFISWIVWRSNDRFWTTIDTASYTVQIPDGWTVSHFADSDTILDADCASCIRYKTGSRARVLSDSHTLSVGDELYQFSLWPRAANQKDEAALFDGYEKIGTVSAKNASGNKYYKLTTNPSDSWGSGHTTYGYALTRGTKTIFVTHTFGHSGIDRHKMVERLIGTIELK